jgi:signal transduction histidine kinase
VIPESEPIHHLHLRVPGSKVWEEYSMTADATPLYKQIHEAWQQQESLFYRSVGGTELKVQLTETRKHLLPGGKDPKAAKQLPDPTVFYALNFSQGYLHVASDSLLNDDEESLLRRMANVFELAYRRFLDLKQAEELEREARIELALERVRARAMAMQRSDELRDLIGIVMDQFHELGIPVDLANFNFHSRTRDWTMWLARPGLAYPSIIHLPYIEHPLFDGPRQAVKRGDTFYSDVLSREEGLSAMKHFSAHSSVGDDPPEVKARIRKAAGLARSIEFGTHVSLTISRFDAVPYSDDENAVLRRLSRVFEQAYTRFIDLQKAEAQAREAMVEASLEKVRARSLAMQKPTELIEVARLLRTEMGQLGVEELETGSIYIVGKKDTAECWYAIKDVRGKNTKLVSDEMTLQLNDTWVGKEMRKFYHSEEEQASIVMKGEERKAWINYCAKRSMVLKGYYGKEIPERTYHLVKFQGGYLGAASPAAISEESWDLLKRVAVVFSLAYTRFKDLQDAEARTREGQIELALERVRAKTMAMHKSEQLPETAQVLFEQFAALGEIPDRIGIGIFNEQLHVVEWWVTDQTGSQVTHKFNATLLEPTHAKAYAAWKQGKDSLVIELTGKALKEWVRFVKSEVKMLIDESNIKDRRVHHMAFFSAGVLLISAHEPMPEATLQLLVRFANVFSQTYTRFLDLQKAEAQAREGQIQLAMERVRARTMAMQKSDELPEAANLLFLQVQSLGMPAWSAGYCIWDDDKKAITLWMSSEGVMQPSFKLPLTEDPSCIHFLEAHQRGEAFYVEAIGGEELVKHYNYMQSLPVVGEVLQSIIDAGFPLPTFQIFHCAYFSKGFLLFITYEPVPDAHDIFKRFGRVFEQTYTRFLDLQKAEVQAREAQIEAALERVRSRTMAMHRSEELSDVSALLYKELRELGLTRFLNCGYVEMDEEDGVQNAWMTNEDGSGVNAVHLPLTGDEVFDERFQAWKRKEPLFRQSVGGQLLKRHIEFGTKHYRGTEIDTLVRTRFADPTHFYCSNFSHGYLHIITDALLSNEEESLLIRCTRVFDMTYKRFLDLQHAEAQAREAQIEAALERVRSRSMAMHKSEELLEVIKVLSEQLQLLNIHFGFVSFGVICPDGALDFWITSPGFPHPEKIHSPYVNSPITQTVLDAQRKEVRFFANLFTPEETREWMQILSATNSSNQIVDQTRAFWTDCPGFARSAVILKDICVFIGNFIAKPFRDDENNIVIRFANVFEQSYTRFLDLQKAEAQAQEAIIQASLERVRSKAMAMHYSKDLAETIHTFYKELVSLNLTPRRCGLGLIEKESRMAELSSMSSTDDGISVEVIGRVELAGHPVLSGIYSHWLTQEEYHPFLRGNEIKEYYQLLRKQIAYPDFPDDPVQYGYFFFFDEGGIYAWTEKELEATELNIYRRFISVISLTYKRYKDLQLAEARAEEAVKQASLDRVRAEIASMRHADDLQRITPLMWRELRTLGVPFFRCGVLIINEDKQKLDYYLSTPEGQPLAALHLGFDTKLTVVQTALNHWRKQEVYTDHWDKEQFVSFARSMMELGQIQTMKSYQGGDQPPESITLQFTPFKQGMLYVGSAEPLSKGQLHLVHSLADAFSTAYARYEDFTRLEAAKATVEKTLSDLRVTQNQLVQSEKMASLGELTAGIAHEIQNPLNFVNNFSEVSKELLDEMEEELKKGNTEDAKQIAKDIIQNLEKINFHGKRADGIVKSMLQHSRKSTGQKELTDINALCDEYLRLAYHGLRAKDKSFNAKFETHLDPAVGSLNVLPQEIGRVVLNLINNAFYAVSEKKKLHPDGYEPTVTVSTKKTGTHIEILVRDNGTGIPQKALDKIFNPFFTTKPTGQGTGLGLSLSYDIITKGHGGELKVVTTEDEGSEFVVQLPIT